MHDEVRELSVVFSVGEVDDPDSLAQNLDECLQLCLVCVSKWGCRESFRLNVLNRKKSLFKSSVKGRVVRDEAGVERSLRQRRVSFERSNSYKADNNFTDTRDVYTED
ncbi:hypothetical protein LOAG_05892 [Loa loa]|uniref:Uncharacterized protein n=1 Tax=Loa loa TaxID=7209 RepID=A0A1S0TZ77_LOALO|nr:hypothetical protein LOAG_05892 [Loa loa]EFO22595.1 hypothetical protein LOAG_05892 [Loa loa]